MWRLPSPQTCRLWGDVRPRPNRSRGHASLSVGFVSAGVVVLDQQPETVRHATPLDQGIEEAGCGQTLNFC